MSDFNIANYDEVEENIRKNLKRNISWCVH